LITVVIVRHISNLGIMEAKEMIVKERLPSHIAIIMDGNGRWAKKRGNQRIFGHKNGVAAVRDVVEGCAELGVEYLTLYAFSTENWKRPKSEVDALMKLLVHTIDDETPTLLKNNVRLNAIGNLDSMPADVLKQLNGTILKTANSNGLTLTLALSYSSRWEIIEAVKKISTQVKAGLLDPEAISDADFSQSLATYNMPDPELLIRTSGEYRVSNFLLWQIAYAELYFTDVLWPDFRKLNLYEAILDFQKRERRFGKTSEQLVAKN
jgi:undecaprenyl diphosphate synthase